MKTVSAETMRRLDAGTIRSGYRSGMELMSRAGQAVAEAVIAHFPGNDPVAILAGKGNNGGDGFIVADLLVKTGRPVRLFTAVSPQELRGDALTAFYRMTDSPLLERFCVCTPEALSGCGVIVDAMLGTGFSGVPRAPFAEWIAMVNHSGIPVIAVDIPSGVTADDGSVTGEAVTADLTVTFGLPKAGLLTGEGLSRAGRIKVAEIGLSPALLEQAESLLEVTTAEDIRHCFGREPVTTYKNSRGHVLVIGGSRWYTGAPFLSGIGALHTGSGLVTVAVPESLQSDCRVPGSLMIHRCNDEGKGYFTAESLNDLSGLLEKAQAVAIGPGMSTGTGLDDVLAELIPTVKVPLVLDADALNVLSFRQNARQTLTERRAVTVLTPHEGEMNRLLPVGGTREDRAKRLAAEMNVYVVLKGPRSIVAAPSGACYYNLSGCTALATAGSGDVLTGILASLLGRGIDPLTAVRAGVYLHGLTGELAAPLPGSGRGVTADRLLEEIVPAMRTISPFA